MPVLRFSETLLPVGQTGFYFQNWTYDFSQGQNPLLFTLGLILALALVSAGMHLYRRNARGNPAGHPIRDPKQIQEIISSSIQERATYEVRFQDKATQRFHFTCSPLEFDPVKGIILELSGFIKPQPTWIGRSVSCYFKVATSKKEMKWSFYHFATTCTGLLPKGSVQCLILDSPRRLERKQRRSHLRLDPPGEDIPEVRLWPETLSNLEQPEDTPPLLWFLNSEPENQFLILNISASGLLLEIHSSLRPEVQEIMEKGKRVFISLFLRDLEQPGTKEFRILAQIRNVTTDPMTGRLLLGLLFVAHHAPNAHQSQPRWIPLDGKGIEEIEDWVFKRHIQIYQQKGLV